MFRDLKLKSFISTVMHGAEKQALKVKRHLCMRGNECFYADVLSSLKKKKKEVKGSILFSCKGPETAAL